MRVRIGSSLDSLRRSVFKNKVDIERAGLVFNLDANNLSTLFYKESGVSGLTPATVGQLVNTITAWTPTGNVTLISDTINTGLTLIKPDATKEKYALSGSGGSYGFRYTKDGLGSAPLVDTSNCFIVVTMKRNSSFYPITANNNMTATILQFGSTLYISTTAGLSFDNTLTDLFVLSINNNAANRKAYINKTNKGLSGTDKNTEIGGIGDGASARAYGSICGIQVYSPLPTDGTYENVAQSIIDKAMKYYGVTG